MKKLFTTILIMALPLTCFGVDNVGKRNIINTLEQVAHLALVEGSGVYVVSLPAYNADVDAAAYEDIWEYGGTRTPGAADAVHYISSSSAADTAVISIEAVKNDGTWVKTTVTLAGQTKTAIGTQFRWLNKVYNGNGTATAGNVYVYLDDTVTAGVPQTAAKVQGYFAIANQESLQSQYHIPAGYTGINYSGLVGIGKDASNAASITMKFQVALSGCMFRTKTIIPVMSAGQSIIQRKFDFPALIPSGSCAKVVAGGGSADNIQVSVDYQILVIRNDLLGL